MNGVATAEDTTVRIGSARASFTYQALTDVTRGSKPSRSTYAVIRRHRQFCLLRDTRFRPVCTDEIPNPLRLCAPCVVVGEPDGDAMVAPLETLIGRPASELRAGSDNGIDQQRLKQGLRTIHHRARTHRAIVPAPVIARAGAGDLEYLRSLQIRREAGRPASSGA